MDDSDETTTPRCCVAFCKETAAGVLLYKPPEPMTTYEQPLCTAHSDPKFHLRPLSSPLKRTWWTWKPYGKAKHSASSEVA